MLYNLLLPYTNKIHFANLFHYITFRSSLAILLSLLFCFLVGPRIIKYLKSVQEHGQPIRSDGPETHKIKAGTPTMGGLMIIGSIIFSTLLLADVTNPYIWISIFVLTSLGLLGFIDDYAKIKNNNHKGVSAKLKLLAQLMTGVIACFFVQYFTDPQISHLLSIPFFKNFFINLWYFYIPFGALVVVGSSNAVNLTDGLDGLAITPIAIAAGSFGIISYVVGNAICANYLQITHVVGAGEITVLCAAIVGASLGFLWFNSQPAEVFMGDTGSLSLGGILGIISVVTKHEIILSIIGGIFVIETLSVIIQVYYFKHSGGKRIFKMAPLHHHFEKQGWTESKVVVRFWILAVIFALVGLSSLKLR
ncbi:MAG: phospho-N-acetylmuramoyl-pentapeptide-transferase [Rickettsiaceae bacterium]|nr:MAG: phospho-N-acetylmuramoyl-pentapeptide-transferase [Rickettsiaceae bacterium]